MVDWNNVAEQAMFAWEQFIVWFLSIPIEAQVLVIIGVVASLILVGVIVYFVLKGVAYLVYYILKGVYLLLKWIFVGIYKLFEEIYYAISGKERPVKEVKEEVAQQVEQKLYEKPIEVIVQADSAPKEFVILQSNAMFCEDCGNKLGDRIHAQLYENGVAFCVHCGKGYRLSEMEIQQY